MKRSKTILLFLLITGLYSCYVSSGSRSPRPVNYDRHSTKEIPLEKLTARIKVFHLNDDSTRIYFSLETRKQDYFLLNDKSKFKAEYRLSYEILRLEGSKKMKCDSASMRLVDVQQNSSGKNITAFFDSKISIAGQYALKINILNLNNNARYDNYIKFSKSGCTEPENYLITFMDNIPLMEKNYKEEGGIILQSARCADNINLFRISGNNSYPKPPFAADNFASENNYDKNEVKLVVLGERKFSFNQLEKGIYTLQTGNNTGIVFYHFNSWYPNSNDTTNFFEPLVYISSKTEFDDFESAEKVKPFFEKFWLDKAGNKQSARKAINEYYKRVFEANAEYTSVKEGWKTDRGMIYIVFGKPSYTEKQFGAEIWIYRTSFNTSMSFKFNKIDNPYSDNDYHLERDIQYKPQWYNAVENWRNARPFSLTGN